MNKTQLKFSSDLMQNYKALRPASVEKDMQAVFYNGRKAFLSISDDGRLYVTAEQECSTAGWERTDISSKLLENRSGEAKVTSFSVNTERDSAKPILAAALTDKDGQYIFLSVNGSVAEPSWMQLTLPEEMKKQSFYDISVSSYLGKVTIIAYYKKKDGTIERYSFASKDGHQTEWIYTPLPTDFTEITGTVIGRPSYSRVDGAYTLGMSGSTNQLIFTPAYNYYNPDLDPASSRLTLPQKVDAISVLLSTSADNVTDIFACGDGSLYVFTADNQDDGAVPVKLVQSPLLYDVRQLFSFESKGRVYLWVLNGSKKLCYLFADKKGIADPESWSIVAELKDGLDYVYPFRENDTNAMYGYTKSGEAILGYESEETGLWSYVTVFVAKNSGKASLINSYVTLIKTPGPEQEVTIDAEDRCVVDINGGIYSFKGNTVTVKSTASCDIRIMELSESVYATKFSVWTDDGKLSEPYDPAQGVNDKLFALNDGGKLFNAVITSQKGETEYLVPRDTDPHAVDAVAASIGTLSEARKDVSGVKRSADDIPQGIHLQFRDGKLTHTHFSHDGNASLPFNVEALRSSREIYSSEDTFGYLRSLCGEPAAMANGVFDVIIDFFDDAWNFIVQTAEKVVSFVVDCAEKVAACAVEIFNIIKVGIEKVIQFLKFVFDIDDIILVKDVIKKIMNVSKEDMKKDLLNVKEQVQKAFEEIDRMILEWGDISDIGDIGTETMQKIEDSSQAEPYMNDVHANYLTNTLSENHETVSLGLAIPCPHEVAVKMSGDIDDLLEIIAGLYEKEKETAQKLIDRVRNTFFDEAAIEDMDLLTIMKKLLALIGSAAVECAEPIAEALIDLTVCVLDYICECLNQDIYIPCVSELLELCGIGSFSVMDVICFVPAFMGSIIYKLIQQKPLVSQKLHDSIMKINSMHDLKFVSASDPALNDKFDHDLLLACKFISCIATASECVFSALDQITKKTSKFLGIASALSGGIDAVFYMAGSFFVYTPLDGKLPSVPKYILAVVKYFPFAFKATSLYYHKDPEKSSYWDNIFHTVYAITSFISIGGNIAYLCMASSLKDVDETERKAYYLEMSSLIPDNVRNIADGLLCYVKPENPILFSIVLAVRSLCGATYGALQVAEGFVAKGSDRPSSEQYGGVPALSY